MLRLNPKDPAAAIRGPTRRRLSPRQAFNTASGRCGRCSTTVPPWRSLGEKAAPLYQWAARKFAGEDLHEEIFWDPTEPPPITTADHRMPEPGRPGRIRLTGSTYEGPQKAQGAVLRGDVARCGV